MGPTVDIPDKRKDIPRPSPIFSLIHLRFILKHVLSSKVFGERRKGYFLELLLVLVGSGGDSYGEQPTRRLRFVYEMLFIALFYDQAWQLMESFVLQIAICGISSLRGLWGTHKNLPKTVPCAMQF